MKVRLVLFAGLKQAAGFKEDAVTLPAAATVGDLLDKRVPQLRSRTIYVAVNEEYAQRDTVLHDGDEVALLPPVSGGIFRPPSQHRAVLQQEVIPQNVR